MQHHWKGLGIYGTVGIEFVLSVLVGIWGGQWLDGRFGTEPWFMVVGFGFGVAAGFRGLWRALARANRELERQEQREREKRRRYHERHDVE